MFRLQGAMLAALLAGGCAHEAAPPRDERDVLAVEDPRAAEPEPVAPRAPQRLSHTVTLGQGEVGAYVPSPEAPPPSAQPSVVVNNNIVVMPPSTYGYGYGYYGTYGGYGGYGYGGYGSSGARAARASAPSGPPGMGSTATGWAGAQAAPAAPGQTPGVGGNWPTVNGGSRAPR